MKNGKSPGSDGIVIEMLKSGSNVIIPILTLLFNKILDSGLFPDKWCEAIIFPLHKDGSLTDVKNYRGISLLNVISKVFTGVLNKRLVTWAQINSKFKEEQAGYRVGYSTVDQIFTFYTIVQKYLSKKGGRFYCIFVDFSSAFDRVPHNLLWYKLINIGIHGKMLTVLRTMYSNLKSCDGLSEYFSCSKGTRQGCMLSPFLFIMYLNEFIDSLRDSYTNEGVHVSDMYNNLKLLLYADDIAMFNDTAGRLQHEINILQQYCQKWGMTVNLKKTKIIVFRNGGIYRKNENCFFQGINVDKVNSYKYLGLYFTSRLSWTKALSTLAQQAEKAMNCIFSLERKCNGIPVKTAIDLFNTVVTPVLTYGSEVWGFTYRTQIEKVVFNFCKKLLGVGSFCSNQAVLGECGLKPLSYIYMTNCIKYWLKILMMQDIRLPKQSYFTVKKLDEQGRKTWATSVKELLYRYGFGHVWLQQGVGDIEFFLQIFTQRVKDNAFQEWSGRCSEISKLYWYCQFKTDFEISSYLENIRDKKLRSYVARLRCSNHSLGIEIHRYTKIESDKYCKFCMENDNYIVEDEKHFIIECNAYNNLREQYIPRKYWNHHTDINYVKLMSSDSYIVLNNLAVYIREAVKLRNEIFSVSIDVI